MLSAAPEVRFCTSRDGVRVAYAVCGAGPPIVKTGNWVSHLQFDWNNPVWCHWHNALGQNRMLIRYDLRGTGLSDRNCTDFRFERFLEDLEAVVDAAGLARFTLCGIAAGSAVALAYAARHPQRVSQLILIGAFARGRAFRSAGRQLEEAQTLVRLVELGADKDEPTFRQFFTTQVIPGATPEQARAFNDLIHRAASGEVAARILRTFHAVDLRPIAPRVRATTLVFNPSRSFRAPLDEGRLVASLIPGARFIPLDSSNQLLMEDEPAWRHFVDALTDFFRRSSLEQDASTGLAFEDLTARERMVLELVAQGLSNRAIAKKLSIAEKKVRNHLSAVLDKLGLPSRAEAIVRSRDAGMGRRSILDEEIL